MKIRSFVSLFLVFGMTSFSAVAEDANVLPQAVSAPLDAASPSPSGALPLTVDKDIAQGASAVDGTEKNIANAPTSPASTDVPTSAATDALPDTIQKNPPAPETAPNDVPVKAGVVRVPYVPEAVMREIKEEIRQEVLAQARGERWGDPGSLPEWLSRISWSGDIRLRYQRDSFPAGNALPGDYIPKVIDNTTDTHNYLRFQARLGMKAKVSDYTFAAFRLTTGTTGNPVSTNQSMGTGFNKSSLVFDRAYVQSAPYYWLALSGGKMPNPWLSTDLVWDSDVNFEGVAGQLKPRFSEEWSGFLTAGAFPFQDIQRSDTVKANSKWLYGGQLGAKWTSWTTSSAQFGVALYQFKNVEGIPNSVQDPHLFDYTAAQSRQKGNSLMYLNVYGDPDIYGLVSKFKELDLTANLDWAVFEPVHVMLSGDYVKNLGFDAAEIERRTGITMQKKQVTGYRVGLAVGYPQVKLQGDWQASVAYKYLQANAVLDALTDSDFHLGGTDAKGFVIGGSYGLDKGTSLGLRWISTDQIDGPPLSIDTLQVDLSVSF